MQRIRQRPVASPCVGSPCAQALQKRADSSADTMQRLRGELADERAKLREVEQEEKELARKAREKKRAERERAAAAAAAAAAAEVRAVGLECACAAVAR